MLGLIQKIFALVNLKLTKLKSEDLNLNLYKKYFSNESINEKRFYNVGAGSFSHPHWTNVDYFSDWYEKNEEYTQQGLQYNLLAIEPLPIDSNSAEIIYSSHTIEHITDEAAYNLFSESFRALKKGGVIRLTCPDIDLFYRAYVAKDYDFYYWKEWYKTPEQYERVHLEKPLATASIEQLFLQKFASCRSTLYGYDSVIIERIEDNDLNDIFSRLSYEKALDECISGCPIEIQKKFPGNHINWWNHNKLVKSLENAGFSNVYVTGHNQSTSSVMRNSSLFDSTHPRISLYVEAVK